MTLSQAGFRPSLFSIGPEQGFADTLARTWMSVVGDDPIRGGDGLILVPTARLARNVAEAFLAAGNGVAMLLPRIETIWGGDYAGPAVPGSEALPPAIGEMRRFAMLTRLVVAHRAARGETVAADQAWGLAQALASLLDEAALAEIDLAGVLPELVPQALAGHWQVTLDFLSIVTERWPKALAEIGWMDPASRQVRVLNTCAETWRTTSPAGPIWMAGFSSCPPSLGRLAHTVSRLEAGRVVFEGFDRTLSAAEWDALAESHPQAGMRALLAWIGARPEEVADIVPADRPGDRERMDRAAWLERAMRPAESVTEWRSAPGLAPPAIELLAARDEQQEAVAIAMALRDAIETPGRRAALVTPDRAVARRVVTELARFGVFADDSAGEPLGRTSPGAFLRLVAASVAEDFAPVPLLALLKHPLAAFGQPRAQTRRLARRLELDRLRGPAPGGGIAGLKHTDRHASQLDPFLDRIHAVFQPLLALFARPLVAPRTIGEELIRVAEAVAADADGTSALWAEEEGAALAMHCAQWLESLDVLDPVPPAVFPGLLELSFGGASVQGRRSLAGRAALETHPRVAILGLIEAQGLAADLIVLGGLVEGVWPAIADPGPWMGKNMRAQAGLPSPELAVGADAHAFTSLCCAGGRVILSAVRRRERAPAVPSRFIARLEACLRSGGLSLVESRALGWARALDQPNGPLRPCAPPAPRPPVSARPRRLSVTRIETWLVDPYAIHAAEILGLRELAPLDEEVDRAEIGTLVHEGLARAFECGTLDAGAIGRELLAALDKRQLRPGVMAWWQPRLLRIARWVADTEAIRRDGSGPPETLAVEVAGTLLLDAGCAPFTLSGRADRIERSRNGLHVLDYKTGSLPTQKDVLAGWHPQLLLEAEMAARGAFGSAFVGAQLAELSYWKLSGGRIEGRKQTVAEPAALANAVKAAWDGLHQRIQDFDDPVMPYLAEPDPARRPRFGATAALSRVQEWRISAPEE